MIDLDDEEEIDDVEKDDKNAEVIDLGTPKKTDPSAADKTAKRSLEEDAGGESESKKAKTSDESAD